MFYSNYIKLIFLLWLLFIMELIGVCNNIKKKKLFLNNAVVTVISFEFVGIVIRFIFILSISDTIGINPVTIDLCNHFFMKLLTCLGISKYSKPHERTRIISETSFEQCP